LKKFQDDLITLSPQNLYIVFQMIHKVELPASKSIHMKKYNNHVLKKLTPK